MNTQQQQQGGRKGPIPAVAIKEAAAVESGGGAGEGGRVPILNGHCNGAGDKKQQQQQQAEAATTNMECCAKKLNNLRFEDQSRHHPEIAVSQKLPASKPVTSSSSSVPVTSLDDAANSSNEFNCASDKDRTSDKNSSSASATDECNKDVISLQTDAAAAAVTASGDTGCDSSAPPPPPLAQAAAPVDTPADAADAAVAVDQLNGVTYHIYQSELNMPDIMRLIQKDLSEPYSIYTYRYFIHNWPNLCFMARVEDECVGAIVCKLDYHKKVVKRGYIAMLAVDSKFRKRAIGSTLVQKAIQAMDAQEADEVVLETEITNRPALRLYENLGFVRDKRLFRYYLNGVDALRLKLWLR